MYAFIRGKIAEKGVDYCVLDCGGVGYHIACTRSALAGLGGRGEEGFVHTLLLVREDDLSLLGFASAEERRMYKKLVSVSGIGPKLAMTVLCGLTAADLAVALATRDDKRLSSVPGVGKKTAQRMILELNEAAAKEMAAGSRAMPSAAVAAGGPAAEAAEVLVSLGFSPSEAFAAAGQIDGTVEEIVRTALRDITRGEQ